MIATLARTLETLFDEKHLTVWRVDGARFSPVYGVLTVEKQQRATLRRLWHEHVAELRAGRVVRADGATLLPLLHDGLVGCVQLAGDPEAVEDVLLPLVQPALKCLASVLLERDVVPIEIEALAQGTASAKLDEKVLAQAVAEVDTATRRLRDAQRRKTLYALEANDWNVSAAARQLRHGRTKMWEVMRALGIVRPAPAPTDPRARRPRGADPDDDGEPFAS